MTFLCGAVQFKTRKELDVPPKYFWAIKYMLNVQASDDPDEKTLPLHKLHAIILECLDKMQHTG